MRQLVLCLYQYSTADVEMHNTIRGAAVISRQAGRSDDDDDHLWDHAAGLLARKAAIPSCELQTHRRDVH